MGIPRLKFGFGGKRYAIRSEKILHAPVAPVVGVQVRLFLKPNDLPKNWEDVTNVKFKVMVVLDDPMRGGPLSGMLAWSKDERKDDARWTKFVIGLRGLNVTVHKSTSASFACSSLVNTPWRCRLCCTMLSTKRKKERPSKQPFRSQQAKIYAKAAHSSAGKLFAQWLVTPEGPTAMDSVGRSSSRKNIKAKTSIANV